MNIYEGDILNFIVKNGYINQRIVAEGTNYSLGRVNKSIRYLVEEGYLNDQFLLTDKANKELSLKKPRNAIILAAGFGMRMIPINFEVPKGLIEIQGEMLIERLICQLHEVNILEIYIVVGFLKEKYEYLIGKYGVNLVYNPDYSLKNNIHSLNLLCNKISNTYIIPCDIWSKQNPFQARELYSWYAVSDKTDDESTVRISRQKTLIPTSPSKSGNSMIGISYLLEKEGESVCRNVKKYCGYKKYDNYFWEEALFGKEERGEVYARVYPSDEVIEINTYEQLRELDDNSTNLDTKTISIIEREMSVIAKDIHHIEMLKKGMTNRSFKFIINDKSYIMRVPGEGTEKLINRKNEYEVYKIIKEKKISDNIVYMSKKDGYKITEFINDSRVCNPYNEKDVKQCMQKLRSFHELKLEVSHTFDIYERIDFYESLWEDNSSIFRDYKETKDNIVKLKQVIDALPKEWVLTHIDAVPDNFLFTENGVVLIDWEYAGMQDPHLDIAMFAIYAMYDREDIERLIDTYFVEGCSKEIRLKIYCYIAVCGLLWSNWCEYKRFCGVEFGEYSLRQYHYAKEYYEIVMKGI